jgi:nitric oxide synthase-interacting protein
MGSEALTYAERRSLGYGTAHERLAKESLGNFGDCQLTLQPAIQPVCTPWGVVFSKEAILEYLLYQKKNLKLRMKVREELYTIERAEAAERLVHEGQIKLSEFEQQNSLGTSDEMVKAATVKVAEETKRLKQQILISGGLNSKVNRMRVKDMKAFWGTDTTPLARPTPSILQERLKESDTCPVTGKKLRLRDLIPMNLTKASSDPTANYMDAITGDVFSNRSRLVCLRPTGAVMLFKTYKRLVEPVGTYDGHKVSQVKRYETNTHVSRIDKKDVIHLQSGGTGYVAHDGEAIRASRYTLLGLGAGMTDLRGQHSGSGTKSGLVLL